MRIKTSNTFKSVLEHPFYWVCAALAGAFVWDVIGRGFVEQSDLPMSIFWQWWDVFGRIVDNPIGEIVMAILVVYFIHQAVTKTMKKEALVGARNDQFSILLRSHASTQRLEWIRVFEGNRTRQFRRRERDFLTPRSEEDLLVFLHDEENQSFGEIETLAERRYISGGIFKIDEASYQSIDVPEFMVDYCPHNIKSYKEGFARRKMIGEEVSKAVIRTERDTKIATAEAEAIISAYEK